MLFETFIFSLVFPKFDLTVQKTSLEAILTSLKFILVK
jgi:hypothetical protein